MPLSLLKAGEESIIKSITGKNEVKKHLEDLGFVVGGKVLVVSSINGNLIVNVKDSRIAIDKALANRIMV